MHTLEIKLKQHTPLIHFQPDQEGATLRASEVKPRLDRFIISQLGQENYDTISDDEYENMIQLFEKENPISEWDSLDYNCQSKELGKYLAKKNKWIANGISNNALDFKLKITPQKRQDNIILHTEQRTDSRGRTKYYSFWNNNGKKEDFPLLLSNMGGKANENELSNFSMYDEIALTLISKHQSLIEVIKKNIRLFFLENNFGQRQDKGFGSFTVMEINGSPIPFNPDDLPNYHYLYVSPTNGTTNIIDFQYKIFSIIDFYWKCLKTGINYTRDGQYNNRYIKAYIYSYLNKDNDKGLTWEKREIKESFGLTTGEEKEPNERKATFVRALLGCPDIFEYKNKGKTVNIEHNENKNSPNYIARIPSPITFKPILTKNELRIYIIPDNSTIKELSKRQNLEFSFECGKQVKTINIDCSAIKSIENLINAFHRHIKKNNFGRIAFDNEEEYERYVDDNGIDESSAWFIPLNFNWRRITNSPVIIK